MPFTCYDSGGSREFRFSMKSLQTKNSEKLEYIFNRSNTSEYLQLRPEAAIITYLASQNVCLVRLQMELCRAANILAAQ